MFKSNYLTKETLSKNVLTPRFLTTVTSCLTVLPNPSLGPLPKTQTARSHETVPTTLGITSSRDYKITHRARRSTAINIWLQLPKLINTLLTPILIFACPKLRNVMVVLHRSGNKSSTSKKSTQLPPALIQPTISMTVTHIRSKTIVGRYPLASRDYVVLSKNPVPPATRPPPPKPANNTTK